MLFQMVLSAKCAGPSMEQRYGSFSEKKPCFSKSRLNLWSTAAWPKHGLWYKSRAFSEYPERFRSNDAYHTLRGFGVEWEQNTLKKSFGLRKTTRKQLCQICRPVSPWGKVGFEKKTLQRPVLETVFSSAARIFNSLKTFPKIPKQN